MPPENPYRTDFPGQAPFVGRRDELERLGRSLRRGRRSIAAVMGGRGMGKTCLALELERRLLADGVERVVLIRQPEGDPLRFFAQLGKALGRDLDPGLPTDSIVEAVEGHRARRFVLLIDEIERLLVTELGLVLLDNLRIAWEQLGGRLGVVIFGGSALRKLLISDASPFLRSAQWLPLRGLSHDECAELVRSPCRLEVADDLVEALWEATCGHPLLLQSVLEEAVEALTETSAAPLREAASALPQAIAEALGVVAQERLPTLFPIWWDNLAEPGQAIYRALLDHGAPVPRADWARHLGPDPLPWIEVLETTGVARVEAGEVLPRGELFLEWIRQLRGGWGPDPAVTPPTRHQPRSANGPDDKNTDGRGGDGDGDEDDSALDSFELQVVRAIERWTRDAHELPSFALKSGRAEGNDRLLPEHHFQLVLAMALRQHGLVVEAEALSSIRGRVDLKIRHPGDGDRRTCVELKIWGRNDYADTVGQLLGYTLATDTFGVIVMIDRGLAPLAPRYHQRVLDDGKRGQLLAPRVGRPGGPYLGFLTEHPRATAPALRLYHFLVQLPV